MPEIKFITGLGNPGDKYLNTRHNFGFKAVDRFAESEQLVWKNWNDMASVVFHERNSRKILLAKPQTFMNNSGFPIKALLQYYKIKSEEMLVVYDDFAISAGEFRFRANGSAGGHNGISSIIEQTGTENFPRLKLGIGPLPKFAKTPDFVLSNFNDDDKQKIEIILKSVKNMFDLIIDDGFDKAVSKLSGGKQK